MQYQSILDNIVDKSKEIFGSQLTGIYLHGSLAMGCFHPEKSDIDLIIVIQDSITDEQKLSFMNVVAELNKIAPDKGLELSIVKETCCKEFCYPTPFELHFSRAHLQWFLENPTDYIRKMNGTDKDLAAHFTIIKKYGIVLYGTAVDEVFADVPREDYIDSICCDVEDVEKDILENPMYMILNLCRVAAFLQNDLILSKKQGGEWGIEHLKPQYQSLIAKALKCYASGNDMKVLNDVKVLNAAKVSNEKNASNDTEVSGESLQAFARYMLNQISSHR